MSLLDLATGGGGAALGSGPSAASTGPATIGAFQFSPKGGLSLWQTLAAGAALLLLYRLLR